jgi:hypothetical protein
MIQMRRRTSAANAARSSSPEELIRGLSIQLKLGTKELTVRFARMVGDVLTMGSAKGEEKQPFKFYV